MERFKVLVTDSVSEEGVAILNREGDIDIDDKAGFKHDVVKQIIGAYAAISTR